MSRRDSPCWSARLTRCSSRPSTQGRRRHHQTRGWQVVDGVVDKHKSAFKKVERKRFEALLAAADAGKIDAIITRHQDRLTRHPETYGRLLEICVRHGIFIHLYTGGVLDLATHAGGFLGTMNTAVAWASRSFGRTASSANWGGVSLANSPSGSTISASTSSASGSITRSSMAG